MLRFWIYCVNLITKIDRLGGIGDKRKREESKLISIIQHCTGDPSQCNKAKKRKRKKKHTDRKEEINLFLFVNDIMAYIDNHVFCRLSTKNLYKSY